MDDVDVKQAAPTSVKEIIGMFTGFMAAYGWYMLFGFVALVYFRDAIEDQIEAYKRAQRKKTDEPDYDEKVRQNMKSIRAKQQELHEQKVQEAAELRKLREEEARESKIDEYDRTLGNGQGFVLGDGTPKPKPKPKSKKSHVSAANGT
ncbi:hypothetical protein, variant [Sphaeroforma arctica JP610]|uniref:Selenoprotein S n=1 Tax=Sphaeroforma arctica JP610 TaxID=667725 RepID=A0A0L0FVP8_9EUKA|nr:hypothetical protein, variant [Sphaeroforma arctica JP610]KNC80616.1 hypothetical protein, variant [Sphaeroforma arctica JP610]|eukprot:XP_014154518.1 hypothetical protein, variant [Sphaeroforma arctica JP610]